jgi:sulfatase modifying factor 1
MERALIHEKVPSKGGCCGPAREAQAVADGQAPPLSEIQASVVDVHSESMISLPGGDFLMGTDYAESFAADGERPARKVHLQPFSIDSSPVTNKRFAAFIEATGYKTEAETFGWSFVFRNHIPRAKFGELVTDTVAAAPWWCQVPGAVWNAPIGPGSHIQQKMDHPVVHVSWNDAQAYCAWSGTRLPTEAEWEYAARGGLVQKLYPWGDKLRPGGEHRCNIWQGIFPQEDTGDDGYTGTCPVTAFPPNEFGLYSVAGNCWEWCQDWFGVQESFDEITIDPRGPSAGTGRVMKGGSFLCHKSYCNRYRVAARSSNTPDSSTANLGFRCAR